MIPKMTHPLSAHWRQPNPDNMLVDDRHAVMDVVSFEALHEYSASIPTGVYEGKMWKSLTHDGWVLKWFEKHLYDSDMCVIKSRKILLV